MPVELAFAKRAGAPACSPRSWPPSQPVAHATTVRTNETNRRGDLALLALAFIRPVLDLAQEIVVEDPASGVGGEHLRGGRARRGAVDLSREDAGEQVPGFRVAGFLAREPLRFLARLGEPPRL